MENFLPKLAQCIHRWRGFVQMKDPVLIQGEIIKKLRKYIDAGTTHLKQSSCATSKRDLSGPHKLEFYFLKIFWKSGEILLILLTLVKVIKRCKLGTVKTWCLIHITFPKKVDLSENKCSWFHFSKWIIQKGLKQILKITESIKVYGHPIDTMSKVFLLYGCEVGNEGCVV